MFTVIFTLTNAYDEPYLKYLKYDSLELKCRSTCYVPWDTLNRLPEHLLKFGTKGLILGIL